MEGAKRKAGIDAFFAPVAKKPPTGQPVGQSDAVLASPAPAAGLAQPPVADDGLTAEQRRRASVNKALALAKAAHLRACAAADGARAEGRPPRLVELLVGDDWASALQSALQAPSFKSLEAFLHSEWSQQGAQVFPPAGCIFRALNSCRLADVRCVILGQDPYHGPGQAVGLSFSVPRGEPLPSSLGNIFRELNSDVGLPRPTHGDLERWAAQGVLMLNAVLTVRAHAANSHAKRGWEAFTDAVIGAVARQSAHPVVFLLWGKAAQEKAQLVLKGKSLAGGSRHVVLAAPHPSGLSAHRGFIGCRHFSAANSALIAAGAEPIDWNV